MGGVIDMIGQKFGDLKVLERDLTRTGGAAYWLCECSCGKIISVRGQYLRSGEKQHCGCKNKGINNPNIDLTSLIGKKFGRLIVLERDLSKPIGHSCASYWICKCECGNTTSVSHVTLTSGKVKSCGCLQSDLLRQKNTKDLTNQRFGMLVAKENTYKLSKYHSYIWRCECDCGNKNYYGSAGMLLSQNVYSCGCNKRSVGEKIINEILLKNNFLFIQEYRFKDSEISKLRYDFAILNDDYEVIRLVEFDGEQHTRPVSKFGGEEEFLILQQHDKLKNEYAKKHNIPLVRIPYKERNNLSLDLIIGDKYLIK